MSESYNLQFSDRALASLKRLEKVIAQRILSKLQWLAANAGVIAHTALTGDWSGFYRPRVGDYRIDHENRLVWVEIIGHRREVYDD